MEAKYVDWVRAQIQLHAPDPSEPERVQVLALAAYNLTKGGGTLFGMHWPRYGLGEADKLRDEALEQLGRWFECLDEHDAVETARFITKHTLQVDIPPPIAEQLRRVESREGLDVPNASEAEIARMGQRIAGAPTALKTSWLSVQAAAQSTMLGLQRLDWPYEPFLAEAPATAAHLAAIENELPFSLPDAFVHVMGLWGRTAFFSWSIPPEGRAELPPGTEGLAEGGFELGLWDLGRVLQLRAQCEVWRQTAQADGRADPRWDQALPFAGEQGKYLAIDVATEDGPVMFLNSDQDEANGHGWYLAPSLTEFLVTWAELGFVGEEITSFAPFRSDRGLSLESETARLWRAFLFQQ